jgi:hypothetical protein
MKGGSGCKLKAWLAKADLYTATKHIVDVCRDRDMDSINNLSALRRKKEPWSAFYEKQVVKSEELSSSYCHGRHSYFFKEVESDIHGECT